MKTYTYDKTRYLISVTITGIFCVLLCLFALVMIALNKMRPLMALVLLVAGYTAFNYFVAKSTPSIVKINDKAISFYAFGREDTYPLKGLKQLTIREFPSNLKMYIRIGDYGLYKGRYWVQGKMFEDGKEMFRKLLDIEYKLFPNTLKARARTTNTEYIEAKKKGEIVKNKYGRKRLLVKDQKEEM